MIWISQRIDNIEYHQSYCQTKCSSNILIFSLSDIFVNEQFAWVYLALNIQHDSQLIYLLFQVLQNVFQCPIGNWDISCPLSATISRTLYGRYACMGIALWFHLNPTITTLAKLRITNCTFLRRFCHLHIYDQFPIFQA